MAAMRLLTLVEHQTRPAVALSREECDALRRAAPSVAVAPAAGRDAAYDLTPGSWIGAINLGSLAIEIRPKLPLEQVLFFLSYALDPRSWKAEPFCYGEARTLLEMIVPSFAWRVQRALRRGMLQGYRSEEMALATVRGRLRFDDQVRERFGRFPPAEVRYDALTEDVQENQLLKAAIARLSRMRLRSAAAARSLRRLEPAFERVRATLAPATAAPAATLPSRDEQLPSVVYTRLNEHYRPALELARLILRSTSFELRHGQIGAAAFLVDMNKVFEDFVVVALRSALKLSERVFPQGASWQPTGMAGMAGASKRKQLTLDDAGAVHLQPDLSWWDGSRCTFVGDVKYKRLGAAGIEHPDLYQLLAYTIAADLPGGLLIYAVGEAEPVSHCIVHAGHRGKELEVTTLDLLRSPEEILRQIETIAQRIRRLRRKAREGTAA